MNYSNLLYRIFKPSRMKSLDLACKTQYLSDYDLKELTNAKFLKLINHIKRRVPYYSDILKDIEIKSQEDLIKIPFLDKTIIRKNLEYIKAVNYREEDMRPNSTSGSTGENLTFFSDNTDHYSGACQIRGDMANGYKFGEKYVKLWGASRDLDNNWKNKLSAKLIKRRITLSSFNMSNENMSYYIRVINKFKPKLIIGYPSGLYTISNYILNNKIKIHSPKTIISGGETLSEFQRKTIENVFKTKLLNRYGSREVNHIAGECSYKSGLHISTDHVIVEIIDENGKNCKPGQTGQIVVTDLDNYAFPLIRYKIGDLGSLSEKKCGCGRGLPLLEKVEGRIFDVVIGPNNNRVTGNYWTLLRNQIQGIQQIQVIQEKKDDITIKIVANDLFNETEKHKLIAEVKETLGDDLIIHIELVENIKLTSSGKFRWVISKVSPYVN